MKKIKLYFVVGIFALGGLVTTYGVCDRGIKEVKKSIKAFTKGHKQEMFCCLKVMIDYHRKHGITEENERKLRAAATQIRGTEEKEDDTAFGRMLIQGLRDGYTIDESGSSIQYDLPFEEVEDNRRLKECSKTGPMRYEVAVNRFLEIADMVYRECVRLTELETSKNKSDL